MDGCDRRLIRTDKFRRTHSVKRKRERGRGRGYVYGVYIYVIWYISRLCHLAIASRIVAPKHVIAGE